MKTIGIFLSLLLALTMLQGCGKSGSSSSSGPGTNQVRLVNATTAYASLDMTSSGARLASAVATGSASSYAAVSSGISTFTLGLSGSGTPLAQTNLSLSSVGVPYTLVAHTGGQQLQVTALTDNEAAPASGDGKIRVSNLALLDTGNVDVYMAGGGGNLSDASALATNLPGTTGYFEITSGTYHIWVTGVGNKTDLRLEIPSVVISDQQVLTLILTSAISGTAGGVLVDGWLVTQQGAVSAQKNVSARVRIAANIAAHGTIVATANGVSLTSSTLISPVVGSYALVPAGPLTIVVNGNSVNVVGNSNAAAAAGADLTLLAVSDGISPPQFFLLPDDNRLPLNGMAKLRLVNGVNGANGLAGNISLTADFNPVAQDVAPGTVSTAASIKSGTISQLEVNSSQANTPLYSAMNVTLQSQGVYSVFMLGNNATGLGVGIVRGDR